MSGRRPRRAATKGVNYREPGDDPELSEDSDGVSSETDFSAYDSALDTSVVANQSGSEESLLFESTVVATSSPVGVPSCGSTPSSIVLPVAVVTAGVSHVELVNNLSLDSSIEEAKDMTAARANQLIAELEAIFFQLDELVEDASTENMSETELTSACAELKELRVQLVKSSQELNLVSTKRDYDDRVKVQLDS